MKNGKNGFTLLELILVIGIIAALVGLAMPYYQDYVGQSKNAVMRSNLHILKKALMNYKADKGSYPLTDEIKAELVPKYIMEFPTDPEAGAPATWGYTFPGVSDPEMYDLDSKYNF
ncbi:MAG: type IV pilin protein [Candidatus Rifleibacteriota bacterium]